MRQRAFRVGGGGDITAPMHIALKIFKSLNTFDAAGELPLKLKLLNWGRNETVNGPVLLDDKSVKVFDANQLKYGWQRVALDFNHNTVPGTEAYESSEEPRKVAAYGTPYIVPGDGLYLGNLQWTPEGQKNAANFADLSPTVSQDSEGRVTALHSAALCRNGAVYGLEFFAANAALSTNTTTEENMDFKLLILTLLGLPETATDSDIQAAYDKTVEAMATSEPTPQPAPEVQAMSVQLKQVQGTMMALSARLDRADKLAVIDEARRQGKEIPLNDDEALKLDLPTLTALCAGLKQTVPLSSYADDRTRLDLSPANTEADKQVAAMLGIDAAKMK